MHYYVVKFINLFYDNVFLLKSHNFTNNKILHIHERYKEYFSKSLR
uniref:Uncharacterized protein n=1 Tax=Siphoviridae sp. ct3gT1 TaxID=2825323 RepID=A0A8S5UJC4_9CAUD|nr:MAG TPA: hypothetical protein [Siphoviridae sp. ct3gT1]